jgi:NAD(P)-dependent dehydrogenase (short-subunit alcohol dehydrogenase family)
MSSTAVSDAAAALTGKRVVITGASRGIGAATAARVAALGAVVIRVARSAMPPLAGAMDLQADLADPRDRDAVLRRISDRHGVPDAIVSNAGAFMIAPLAETTDALLREQLAINLEAPFAIARHFLPAMAKRGHGSHILVGSVADSTPFGGNSAYAASKYGARGLHEVLCEEFRGTGVRCTLVSPGPTDTAAWDLVDPDAQEGYTHRADMLRPADVAEAIVHALTAPAHMQVESIRLGPA